MSKYFTLIVCGCLLLSGCGSGSNAERFAQSLYVGHHLNLR